LVVFPSFQGFDTVIQQRSDGTMMLQRSSLIAMRMMNAKQKKRELQYGNSEGRGDGMVTATASW
jgi:hypothetical protein